MVIVFQNTFGGYVTYMYIVQYTSVWFKVAPLWLKRCMTMYSYNWPSAYYTTVEKEPFLNNFLRVKVIIYTPYLGLLVNI